MLSSRTSQLGELLVKTETRFDIAFLGHYTKDTIVLAGREKVVDGGAVNYGANVTARMGLRTAIITRMAPQDLRVFEELLRMGVQLLVHETAESTQLRLIYPSSNLDNRVIRVTGFAGPFAVEDLHKVEASVFHVGASMRGEVPVHVVHSLRKKTSCVSLDLQGFIRIDSGGELTFDGWKDRQDVLKYIDIVKADLVEATMLTGKNDRHEAAEALTAFGLKEVVLTHNGGVLVHAEDRFYEAPFMPKELRGRSGRGDTCIAAYLGKRLTAPPEEATVWAAAVTSLKLEDEGPFRRDIDEVRKLIQTKYLGRS